MYNSRLENELIDVDIVSLMQDYVSLQLDIDETRIKAAAYAAQKLDIEKVIGKASMQRVIDVDESIEADVELKELIIPAWCYLTYYRLLKNYQGSYTDSGFVVEATAESISVAKSVANQNKSTGEGFLEAVVEFLKAEDSNVEVDEKQMTRNVRVMGGQEMR